MSKPYVRPVPNYGNKWLSSFTAHTRRNPPSSEPGVDYYCPLGTTLVSIGDGVVKEVGGSIYAKAGRYVKVNLDDGRSFRLLHLGPRHSLKRAGDRVRKGEALAISGASGYGSEYFGASSPDKIPANTGGPHTHATLFPTWAYNNFRGLLDLEQYVDTSATAGGGSRPFDPETGEEIDMADNLTIYRKGGDLRAVGFNRDFRIGGALTTVTGVDGAETLAVLIKAGAEVIDLDQRQWDVMNVTLDATAGKPVDPLDEEELAKSLAAAIIKALPPTSGGATPAQVTEAVKAALSTLVLKTA